MHITRLDLVRVLLSSILLAGAAGCAAAARVPWEQAAQVDPGSGLVFGSIRISVDSSLPDTTYPISPGRKTFGTTHSFVIDCSTELQRILGISNETVLALTLDNELVVVQKLPARRCELVLEATGGFTNPGYSCIGSIDVRGGSTIYIGAVELALPTVGGAGARMRRMVTHQKARTVEVLRPEYGALFDDAQLQPVAIDRQDLREQHGGFVLCEPGPSES